MPSFWKLPFCFLSIRQPLLQAQLNYTASHSSECLSVKCYSAECHGTSPSKMMTVVNEKKLAWAASLKNFSPFQTKKPKKPLIFKSNETPHFWIFMQYRGRHRRNISISYTIFITLSETNTYNLSINAIANCYLYFIYMKS